MRKNPNFNKITVAHLLNHTSGIWQFTQESFNSLVGKTDKKLSFEKVLDLKKEEGEFGKYSYSNAGYEMLALVMEKDSGKRFEDLERDLVLKPLNLEKEIFLRDDLENKDGEWKIKNHPSKNYVAPRYFDGEKVFPLANQPFCAGAGMYANPASVAKLAKGIWTAEYLKDCEKYEVSIGGNTKYGIGYIRNGNMINHDGGMDGTKSSVILDCNKNKAGCVSVTLENLTPPLAEKAIEKANEVIIYKGLEKELKTLCNKPDPSDDDKKRVVEIQQKMEEFEPRIEELRYNKIQDLQKKPEEELTKLKQELTQSRII